MRTAPNPTRPQAQRTQSQRLNTYWPTLAAFALLCALLALLVLLIAQPGELSAAARVLVRSPEALAPREVALLVLAAAIPLATALMAYVIGAQGVRLLRIWLYLRRVHAYAGRRLRSFAPLHSRGLEGRIQRLGRHGEAQGEPLAVQRLLSARAPVLLTGEAGSGKTTALLSLAYELSRRRAVFSVFFGRQRLPVLVPLAGYAADLHGAAGPRLDYLQRQVARYGSPGLAARLPRLIRQGRALLLCDSLSDAPLGAQGRILEDLAVLPPARRGPSVILARGGMLGASLTEYVTSEWEHWRIAPLAPDETLRIVQSALPRASALRNTRRLREELRARRLERALGTPALLLTFSAARSADTPLPHGRAALLQQALAATCAQEATDELPAAQLRQTLGAIASALAAADLHAIPLPPGAPLGEALAAWLSQHRPFSPLASAKSGPLVLSTEVAHACCLAGLRAGALAVTSDDSGLTFAHSLVEAACAAEWLRATDDGASALDPGLLRPRWALPVVLWTATAADPGVVTRRLLPLIASRAAPQSGRDSARGEARKTLSRAAHSSEPQLSRPAGVALALAGITAALAPALASLFADGRAHEMEVARFERRLREVLDATLELLTPGQDPAALAAAVQSVEGVVGDELAADVAYLATIAGFSSLARAQLVSILGLLTSPLALDALVEHLADKDPTLRAAVGRGFALAGNRAVGALQGQLTNENEWARARAREALDGIRPKTGVGQLAEGDTAQQQAVHALASADPATRAAAAETLGALRAHEAVDALADRLADPDPHVRIAALRALARLADPAALPVLREQLRYPDPAFRATLAETLGAYHDPFLIPDLSLLLADGDGTVRAAAATALGMIGDGRAVQPLLEREADPDPRVSAAVASALRRLGQAHEGAAARRQTSHPQLTR